MKYISPLAATLVLLCLLCSCNTQDPTQQEQPTKDYGTTNSQVGTQYDSSWVTDISKTAACQNPAIADWIARCAQPERDDIGHYVLHNKVDNGDGTTTHHLLLYRSATQKDIKAFSVDFALNGDTLTVTPTYTSSDALTYGYDLIYLTLRTEGCPDLSVELLVDGDYPGQIQTTTADVITPDTFGTQADE